MSGAPLNKEARLHRLQNQRRIAATLIGEAKTFLQPGTPFAKELSRLFSKRGRFGSRDRRLYRDIVYAYLRFEPWLGRFASEPEESMDRLIALAQPTSEIETLYPTLGAPSRASDGKYPNFNAVGMSESDLDKLLPEWFSSHVDFKLDQGELQTLFARTPLWLRVQSGRIDEILERANERKREPSEVVERHAAVPNCIRAPHDFRLSDFPPYLDGRIEVQDISSQALLQLVDSPIEGSWLDACAGAGGKSLQLASILGESGTVTAFDKRYESLRVLEKRAKRADIRNIDTIYSPPETGTFDGVLVDAPCSGSGTWRRHPFLMRQTSEESVMAHANEQLDILRTYSNRVRIDGLLVYCTCSLSRYENDHVAEAFLSEQEGRFEIAQLKQAFGLSPKPEAHGVTISPSALDGDGLYIACFRKIAK